MTDVPKNEVSRVDQGLRDTKGYRATLALFLASLALLGVFAFFAGVTDRFPGDIEVSRWVQSFQTPRLDNFMEGVSLFGNTIPAAIIIALSVALLFFAGRRGEAALLGSAALIAYLINTGLKLAIDRPRPSPSLVQVAVDASGGSFPSSHAMHMMVFLGLLAFLAALYLRPEGLRWLSQVLLLMLLLVTGLSRIYLGAHWFSDVVGGYLFGLVVVVAAVWSYRLWLAKSRGSPGVGLGP